MVKARRFDGGGSSCLGVWHGPSKYSKVCMGCHKACIYLEQRMRYFPQHVSYGFSTTLYSIWIERLRRLEDATLPQEVCNARAKTQFRRAVMRFQNSTYQPDMGEYGLLFTRVRSELADILICFSDPPPLRASPLSTLSSVLYLLFFDGGSRGNPGPSGVGSVRWVLSMA